MSYWRDRVFNQQKILLDKSIDEVNLHLATVYKSSMKDVEKDMKALLFDLQKEDGVKINDLYRYNRYWELRNDINHKLVALGQKEIRLLDKELINMYMKVQDYFNKNPKFLAKTENGKVVKMVNAVPVDMNNPIVSEHAQAVVDSLWCADGKYWSERVWGRMDALQGSLEQGLTDIITRGVGPDEVAATIAKEFGKEFSIAQTLVRTELNHVYTQTAAERYKEAGCEYYEVLSNQSDDECFDMNGAIIRFSEMVEGDNCPPFHPNCRCTILPVIGGRNEKD